MFRYEAAGKESVVIGSWSPAIPADSTGIVNVEFHATGDPKEADRWRAELASGRLPLSGENTS